MKRFSVMLICFLFLLGSPMMLFSDQTEPYIIIDDEIEEEEQEEILFMAAAQQETINTQPEIITGQLIINKQLIAGTWHVACDVMGDQAWVKDEISNPKGIPSKEGHRLAFCGDPAHWIIWLNKKGKPFLLQEIKSGSTGGTLNTKIYTDATYTTQMSIYDIKPNERIYWTTFNGGQVWHHTGITYPQIPSFTFLIDGQEYNISAGQELKLENLPVGEYQIIEKYDPNYFISDVSIPFTVNEQGDVVIKVQITENNQNKVEFVNQRITPDQPIIEPDTQQQQSETEKQTQTQPIIETQQTQTETQLQTEKETQVQTQAQTEKQTQIIPPIETQTPPKQTQKHLPPIKTRVENKIITQVEVLQEVKQEVENSLQVSYEVKGITREKEKQTQKAKKKYRKNTEQTNFVKQETNETNHARVIIPAPKTGDNTHILRFLTLFGFSAISILIALIIMKKMK